ncbi:hypothetical protein K491DRAFT_669694 [Lophiostoma macrostomum CBS 122681]|uniref:Uncharacterized protein n=1 Tax=Lophiostoma macrostomum CBS 122681 TaxID=1314788 RepID=A0A6A6SMC5_9PLEO|nr:hypothetical protein K491DRAFT_669694 [Lophiostoma macrostomum CBS 122681]
MAPSLPSTLLLPTLTILAILPLLAHAGRIDNGECPPDNELGALIYSPFKPYFWWPMWQGHRQKCWVAADCLFEAAGESRKQQFAATALIMGLIPLTLKDIAWPEQRIVHVTRRLPWAVEVAVLALGLVPLETQDEGTTEDKVKEENLLARAVWRHRTWTIVLYILLSALGVLASYGGMAIVEIYSKRSALGCPWPIWVVCWYVVALVPAAVHATFAKYRRMREKNERKQKIISAVQGADEDWPVQLSWGIYYIAGTLIWTSIMAITVAELVVWVGLGVAVSASSKLLAFFLCLFWEKVRARRAGAGR